MEEKQEIRLLLKAKNRTGISAEVSDIISSIGGDITYENGFEDEQAKIYFLRRVFYPTKNYEHTKKSLENKLRQLQERLENPEIKISYPSENKKQVAVLVSKETHCLDSLLHGVLSNHLDMEIKSIVSNHEEARKKAEMHGIPFSIINPRKDNSGDEYKIEETIGKVDLVVLARYMQIVSKSFIEKYKGNIINVHHGLLPAFKGANPYKQAYLRGVTKIGATAHFATENLDDGPIIVQADKDVLTCRTIQEFKMKGISAEQEALVEGVQMFLEDRLIRYKFQDETRKSYEKVAKFF